MNLIDRAKKIMLSPKEEWAVIETESTDVATLVTGYLIPLALIAAVASFIGYGLIGVGGFGYKIVSISLGIRYGVISLVTTIAGAFIAALVINALSASFASRNDFRKALQLVVYSFTPMMVAGILYILPGLRMLPPLAGIYGLYLLYIGMKPLMQTPEDKVTSYFIVSLLVMIGVYIILGAILTAVFIGHRLMM
jgi:hypothetical protein